MIFCHHSELAKFRAASSDGTGQNVRKLQLLTDPHPNAHTWPSFVVGRDLLLLAGCIDTAGFAWRLQSISELRK